MKFLNNTSLINAREYEESGNSAYLENTNVIVVKQSVVLKGFTYKSVDYDYMKLRKIVVIKIITLCYLMKILKKRQA